MELVEQFYGELEKAMVVSLATTDGEKVTMRYVSPVVCGRRALIFTSPGSNKYRQLRARPRCCIGAGTFFAEAEAEFMGPTMSDGNAELRAAYCEKYPDAFAEGVEFGGREDEFILFSFTRLSGWAFENGMPTAPFDIALTHD